MIGFHSEGQEKDLLIVLKDPSNYTKEIENILKNKELNALTIRIEENYASWVVFGSIPNDPDSNNQASYSLKHNLPALPKQIFRLRGLKKLNISYLGLGGLPKDIERLRSLEELDISFNNLNLSQESDKIVALKNLRVLEAYGCGVDYELVANIKASNPELTVYFTKEQFLNRIGN